MPLSIQRRNIVLHNRSVASAAFGREHIEVIISAIRLPISLVEALLSELLSTLRAEEVFRVPGLLQGSHAFLFSSEKREERIAGGQYKETF